MISAAPTLLAIEGDSAWIVILAVSVVTLPAVLLLRRFIHRTGGLASGLLLTLPLLLPLVAALTFDHAALPVVAVLRPAGPDVFRQSTELLHLLFLAGERHVVTAYTLSETAGAWMVWVGLSVSSFMLVRRFFGTYMVRRLIKRCRPLDADTECDVRMMIDRISAASRLTRAPRLLVLPAGASGAFAVSGKGGRILVSRDLLCRLDREELEGILAHEIAHLEARDVPLTFVAGVMRDLVAWNPFAHVAYRKLAADREIEADRRATALTGNPLALASGLVRLCELKRSSRKGRHGFALAFGGGRVSKRVGHLLALADGRVHLRTGGTAPYLLAAVLAATLGLQVAAKISAQGPGAFAIVWGSTTQATTTYWSPDEREGQDRKPRKLDPAAMKLGHPEASSGVAFKERYFSAWSKAMEKVARRAGLSHEILPWKLQEVPVFSGPITVYRIDRLVSDAI